jgi:hypothetical protein
LYTGSLRRDALTHAGVRQCWLRLRLAAPAARGSVGRCREYSQRPAPRSSGCGPFVLYAGRAAADALTHAGGRPGLAACLAVAAERRRRVGLARRSPPGEGGRVGRCREYSHRPAIRHLVAGLSSVPRPRGGDARARAAAARQPASPSPAGHSHSPLAPEFPRGEYDDQRTHASGRAPRHRLPARIVVLLEASLRCCLVSSIGRSR